MIQLENLHIIIPIGLFAIAATMYLILTGNRKQTEKTLSFTFPSITILHYSFNILNMVYLSLVVTLFIIGILSTFFIATLVGTMCAMIPFLFIFLISHNKNGEEKNDFS